MARHPDVIRCEQQLAGLGVEAQLGDRVGPHTAGAVLRAVCDISSRYPLLLDGVPSEPSLRYPDGRWKLRAIKAYSQTAEHDRVRALGLGGWGCCDARVGGPRIYINDLDEHYADEDGSLYADMGITSWAGNTIYGCTVHELGHAMHRIGLTYNLPEVAYARDETGFTDRIARKQLGWYATTSRDEFFAEAFAVLNLPDAFARCNKATQTRLRRFARAINRESAWRGQPEPVI